MDAERGAGREALRVQPGKRRPEPEPERQLEPEPEKPSLLCNPASNHNDDSDSGLSDSKESVFSGLEDSGSDSSEDTEDKEDGSNCDKDDGSTEETSKEQAQPDDLVPVSQFPGHPQSLIVSSLVPVLPGLAPPPTGVPHCHPAQHVISARC
ncbi:Ribosome biogenesis protein BOP1 [Sciurus carolinensis]|uniref:Ribosome biogenesis protein BOP1 n=1 Tax=Sciurus carolinensis TaxID=30640 RepID=A0AA41SVH3_SCICA|nr:Ribosome biogenesis protein BOP1 [Sciurus carolinensis]